MVRTSIAHLVKVLRFALGIANSREPHIRTMCGRAWVNDLEKLSPEILCKKLHFLLLHCGISTINHMYEMGLFRNRDILSIAVRAIRQRNEHTNPMASCILQRHCKYILLIKGNLSIIFKSQKWIFSDERNDR